MQPDKRHIDVLIVGAGPAGLMASMYLSELGVSHRIIDKRGTRTLNGRADGFQIRTMEIWESFNIVDKLLKHGAPFGETNLWTFSTREEGIVRAERDVDVTGEGASRFEPRLMHQGLNEAVLIEEIRKRGGPGVERGASPYGLSLSEDKDDGGYVSLRVQHSTEADLARLSTGAHSIQADGSITPERGLIDALGTDPNDTIPSVSGPEGTTEDIHAKYIIGADGARSWTRAQLPNIHMQGDETDSVFGVIDIYPLTDFPDIRKACPIMSAHGYCLQIPRENGLVRLYVQFPDDYFKKDESALVDRSDPSVCADIMSVARKMYAPYRMDYRYCDWFTVYRVGQRVSNKFSYLERVFLAGDAVHTHSPMAGMGQNVSQQDTYNLSWKLAGVLRGQMKSSILSTYESERRPVAKAVIEHDKQMGQVLFARAKRDEEATRALFADIGSLNGTLLRYSHSLLIAKDGDTAYQAAAKNLPLGERFASTPVWSQATARQVASQTVLKSDGSWRLAVFAGDVAQKSNLAAINGLGDRIVELAHRYPPLSSKKSRWLQVLLFHSISVADVEINDFHDAFFPWDDIRGRDYGNVYADRGSQAVEKPGRGAHQEYGVDVERGALVCIRPDQTVCWVGRLDDLAQLEAWLARFMIPVNGEDRMNGRFNQNGR